jgi:hypothetical protein
MCQPGICSLTEYDLLNTVNTELFTNNLNYSINSADLEVFFMGISPNIRNIIDQLYTNNNRRRKLQLESCTNTTVSNSWTGEAFEQFAIETLRRQDLYFRALSLESTSCTLVRRSNYTLNYFYYPISAQRDVFSKLNKKGIVAKVLNMPPSPPSNPPQVPMKRKKSGFWFFFFSASSLFVFIIYWTFDPKPKDKEKEEFDSI